MRRERATQKKATEGELPPQLLALLDAIVDRELAMRLGEVMAASGRCIERLAAINLVALEPKDSTEGSADLTLWEKMAPAVADTVVAVNELCAVIDASFPPGRGNRTSLFGEDGSDQRADFEAAAVFRTISPLIQKEVAEVGALVRRPELLSSAWALLGELQRLRAEIRVRVSDGVYLSAAALGPVSREEVVPGFSQEVLRALSFRGTASALRRTAKQRLEGATSGAELAKSLEEDFEALTAMPAWRHVKIETKRAMLELRARLEAMASEASTQVEQVRATAEPMLEVLEATSGELSRNLLIAHDRQARDLSLRRAEQAELHLALGTGAAGWALEAGLDAAAALRGCDEQLDQLLRDAGKLAVGELPESELLPLAAAFAAALGRLEL